MKKILIFLCLSFFIGCNTSSKKKSLDSEEYEDIIGFFDREELDFEPHSEWFKKNYSDYDLDLSLIHI